MLGIVVFHCSAYHIVDSVVGDCVAKVTSAGDEFEHGACAVERAFAVVALNPRESAVRHLQVEEFCHYFTDVFGTICLVEEFGQFRHSQCLAVCLVDPWRCQKRAYLQVAIASERRNERALCAVLLLPVGDSLGKLWVLLCESLCKRQREERVHERGRSAGIVV